MPISQTKSTKLVKLELPTGLYDQLLDLASQKGNSLSEVIAELLQQKTDTTDYLLSTQANRTALEKSMQELKNQEIITFSNPKEAIEYVKNLAN